MIVRVGIGVSVLVRDVPVDPAVMLAGIADLARQHDIVVTRFDDAPGALRRLAAATLRRVRTGFTATILRIEDDADCLCVALAGRELDDQPRSIEFQAAAPSTDADHPDLEGYCLVNEDLVPVYNALVSVRLTDDRLRLTLTRAAADAWALRSTAMTIRLALEPAQIGTLRVGMRQVFVTSGRQPEGFQL